MQSITITSPNPAVIARLQEELPKLLTSLERMTADKHTKRGYALTTISNETVLNDEANKAIAAIIEYAEAEANSLDAHGRDDEACAEEAKAAWETIERVRAIIAA